MERRIPMKNQKVLQDAEIEQISGGENTEFLNICFTITVKPEDSAEDVGRNLRLIQPELPFDLRYMVHTHVMLQVRQAGPGTFEIRLNHNIPEIKRL